LRLAELIERTGELILDDPAQIEELSLQTAQQLARLSMADRVIGRLHAGC